MRRGAHARAGVDPVDLALRARTPASPTCRPTPIRRARVTSSRQSARRCCRRQLARSLSSVAWTSIHSAFASSTDVSAGAGWMLRMRAFAASTGRKSATRGQYPTELGRDVHDAGTLGRCSRRPQARSGSCSSARARSSPTRTAAAVACCRIALAHGIALAVAVSAFGGLSGAHFNPAVTFALAIIGRHPWSRVPTYVVAQLAGGLLAGFALRGVFDFALAAIDKTHLGTPALANGVSVPVAIGVEALLTIFLVWAVYGTAVSPLAPRIAGFGIGLTVATDILMGGPLTGAAMNPARHVATADPGRVLRQLVRLLDRTAARRRDRRPIDPLRVRAAAGSGDARLRPSLVRDQREFHPDLVDDREDRERGRWLHAEVAELPARDSRSRSRSASRSRASPARRR